MNFNCEVNLSKIQRTVDSIEFFCDYSAQALKKKKIHREILDYNRIENFGFNFGFNLIKTKIWRPPFYLPHMEYEGSIGLVSRKMKNSVCHAPLPLNAKFVPHPQPPP
jgi:hypothetical protein